MIINREPLAIIEVLEKIKDSEGKEALISYLKKFSKISKKEADKIQELISALKNPKIKKENIIKIIDFLPKNQEELGKIFNEISLNENETNSILEIVREY